MKKYTVKWTETYIREVEAENADDAIELVLNEGYNCEDDFGPILYYVPGSTQATATEEQ